MQIRKMGQAAIFAGAVATLASCGGSGNSGGFFGLGGAPSTEASAIEAREAAQQQRNRIDTIDARTQGDPDQRPPRSTVWDLFRGTANPNNTVAVNRYLWQASLEVLNFLPIESVDPFTGVIVTGYGTPPGGGQAYRATIYVQDPALDARSLRVALLTRGGAVDPATQRAVEDAILTRARQLRIRDGSL